MLAEYARLSPSGSVAVTLNVTAEPGLPDLVAIDVNTGGRFGTVTVMVAVVLALREPSLTVKVGVNVPVWLVVGVHANICVPVLNVAPDGRLPAEYVRVFPSGSEPVTVNVRALPAVTDWVGIAVITGGRLAGVTVIVALVVALREPSLTVKVGVNVPVWLVVGVHANV